MKIESKLRQLQKGKEEKLKQFQMDVSQRVKALRKQKQKEEMNKSFEMVSKTSTSTKLY